MLRKSVLTLACTFALAGSVWADTPIGPLARPERGAPARNEADGNIRNGEGGAGPKRQDGMPLDQADTTYARERRRRRIDARRPPRQCKHRGDIRGKFTRERDGNASQTGGDHKTVVKSTLQVDQGSALRRCSQRTAPQRSGGQ